MTLPQELTPVPHHHNTRRKQHVSQPIAYRVSYSPWLFMSRAVTESVCSTAYFLTKSAILSEHFNKAAHKNALASRDICFLYELRNKGWCCRGSKSSWLEFFKPHHISSFNCPVGSRLKNSVCLMCYINRSQFKISFCCWSKDRGTTACSCSGILSTIERGQLYMFTFMSRTRSFTARSHLVTAYMCVSECVCVCVETKGVGDLFESWCMTGGILTTPTFPL